MKTITLCYNPLNVAILLTALSVSTCPTLALAEAGAKSMFADEGASVMMNDDKASTGSKSETKTTPSSANLAKRKSTSDDSGYAASEEDSPIQPVSNPGSYSGLQYWIDLQDSNGGSHRVTTNHAFRSGDRIKLQIKSKTAGYMYVLNQDSTGKSTPLYPSKGQNAYINTGVTYSIPERGAIRFDNVPGQEKITIALSKYSIGGSSGSSSRSNPEIPVSYNPGDCSGGAGSKGMFAEEGNSGDCSGASAKPVSFKDCMQTGGAGSKGMFADEGVDINCVRSNHSAGGAGSKGMFSEEDTSSAQPASYSVVPTANLDQGQVLFVDFYLTHR